MLLQITKCNGPTSYNITGLQSNTQYSIGVTVCTIAGEGPIAMVTGRTTVDTPLLTETGIATSTSLNIINIATSTSPNMINVATSSIIDLSLSTQSSTSTLSPSGLYYM